MIERLSAHVPSECDVDGCITCGDLAKEVRVVELLPDDFAIVEVDRKTEMISVALVDAAVDDRLLVHAGEAIARLERG